MNTDIKLFDGFVLFIQVVKANGFTAASLINGHSTSFISKEINKLESRLGVRLLNRTTRKISLTPEGNVFYHQCEQMLIDAEHSLSLMYRAKVKPKGILKISCPIGYGMTHLQPIFIEYSNLYPDVNLVLDFNDRKVDIIEEGYDLVIRASQYLDDSTLICKKITSYNTYIIASQEYLKSNGTPKIPEDLLIHKCISYSNLKNPTKWSFESQKGKKIQINVPATILCNNAEIELSMVLNHKGVCRLPEFYIEKELKENTVTVLLKDFILDKVDIYALYPSRKHLSPKIIKFIEILEFHLNPKD